MDALTFPLLDVIGYERSERNRNVRNNLTIWKSDSICKIIETQTNIFCIYSETSLSSHIK